jgi:hypothetical protein
MMPAAIARFSFYWRLTAPDRKKATFWFVGVWGVPDTLQGKSPRWDGCERLGFDFEDIN